MPEPIKVVQYGLGPIGQSCVRTVLEKSHVLQLVGAIDIDPEKAGRDLAELLDLDRSSGIVASRDAEQVLRDTRPDIVLHTTSSFLDKMYDQLVLCARMGANVVSSTEELSFPYRRHPRISRELDAVARENGVTLLGTGVNPGYAMDALALMATGVCKTVNSVTVHREVDAGLRRKPLQMKVGAGITTQDFAEKKAAGQFGHIGLVESLLLVSAGLGWQVDEVEESLQPVISDKTIETPFLTVEAGRVAGIDHVARGLIDGQQAILLDLKMYVGADNPRDAVLIDGDPPIDLEVRNGIFGDSATVAALVNGAPLAIESQPGLKTVKDVPLLRAFGTLPLLSE